VNRLARIPAAATLMVVCATPVLGQGQQPTHDVNALARETQNPLGSLISVPFQFNFNTGGDLEDRTLFNLNVQPVIPLNASQNWSVI
jgi:hypothetical protein